MGERLSDGRWEYTAWERFYFFRRRLNPQKGWREFLPWLERGENSFDGRFAIWHAPKWASRLSGHGEQGLELWRSKNIRMSEAMRQDNARARKSLLESVRRG